MGKRPLDVGWQTKHSEALPPTPRDLTLWRLPDVSQEKAARSARPIRIVIRIGARVASQRCPILRTDMKSLSHDTAMARTNLRVSSPALCKQA